MSFLQRVQAFLGARRVLACSLADVVLGGGGGSARAADPVGAPLGNNKFKGTISIVGDQDDVVGELFRGDVLTVTVTALKKRSSPPTLHPQLTLIDPSGDVRTAGIVVSTT